MPVLDRAPIMQAPLGFNVGDSGGLFVSKEPDMDALAAKVDFGPPFAGLGVPRYAHDAAAFVVDPGAALVLGIHGRRRNPQVGNSVVSLVAIDVVKHAGRPLAVDIQPRQPMRRHSFVVKPDEDVTGTAGSASSHFAGLPSPSIPAPPVASPGENAGFLVVIEKLSKACGVNSHARIV